MLVWNYYTSLRIFWRTCFNSLEQDMQLAFSYRLLRIFTLTVWVLRSKQSLPKNQKEGFKTSFTFYMGDLERGSRCKHNDAACNGPHVLNSGYQASDQPIPEWNILTTVIVPV